MKIISVFLIALFTTLNPENTNFGVSGNVNVSPISNMDISTTGTKTLTFHTRKRLMSEFVVNLEPGQSYSSYDIRIPSLAGNPHKTKYNDYYCFCDEPTVTNNGRKVTFRCVDFDVEMNEMSKAQEYYSYQRDKFFRTSVKAFLKTAEPNTDREVFITVHYN